MLACKIIVTPTTDVAVATEDLNSNDGGVETDIGAVSLQDGSQQLDPIDQSVVLLWVGLGDVIPRAEAIQQ